MSKLIPWLVLSMMIGCTRSYQVREERTTGGHNGQTVLQERFAKAKANEWFQVVLRDGTMVEGTFFSVGEGIVTLQSGNLFRDVELTEIATLRYRPVGHAMNFWVYPLAGLVIGFIIFSFINE